MIELMRRFFDSKTAAQLEAERYRARMGVMQNTHDKQLEAIISLVNTWKERIPESDPRYSEAYKEVAAFIDSESWPCAECETNKAKYDQCANERRGLSEANRQFHVQLKMISDLVKHEKMLGTGYKALAKGELGNSDGYKDVLNLIHELHNIRRDELENRREFSAAMHDITKLEAKKKKGEDFIALLKSQMAELEQQLKQVTAELDKEKNDLQAVLDIHKTAVLPPCVNDALYGELKKIIKEIAGREMVVNDAKIQIDNRNGRESAILEIRLARFVKSSPQEYEFADAFKMMKEGAWMRPVGGNNVVMKYDCDTENWKQRDVYGNINDIAEAVFSTKSIEAKWIKGVIL